MLRTRKHFEPIVTACPPNSSNWPKSSALCERAAAPRSAGAELRPRVASPGHLARVATPRLHAPPRHFTDHARIPQRLAAHHPPASHHTSGHPNPYSTLAVRFLDAGESPSKFAFVSHRLNSAGGGCCGWVGAAFALYLSTTSMRRPPKTRPQPAHCRQEASRG